MPNDKVSLMGLAEAISSIVQYTAPFASADALHEDKVHSMQP
jgi:hypothetical protein